MKKVWLIEQGEYSDYRVVGVFSTKEKADMVVSKMKDNGFSVTEWPFDPGVNELNKGYSRFRVTVHG